MRRVFVVTGVTPPLRLIRKRLASVAGIERTLTAGRSYAYTHVFFDQTDVFSDDGV